MHFFWDFRMCLMSQVGKIGSPFKWKCLFLLSLMLLRALNPCFLVDQPTCGSCGSLRFARPATVLFSEASRDGGAFVPADESTTVTLAELLSRRRK